MAESTHDKYIQHHGPVNSDPQMGDHGTHFEKVDASVKMVLGSLAIIAFTLVVTALLTVPIENLLKRTVPTSTLPSPLAPARVIPKGPLLQVHPWNELPLMRATEDKMLSKGGTDAQGQKHIPIDNAMAAVIPQLKVRPDASPGLMVPGGQGRDFAGSLAAMPSAYKSQGTVEAGQTSSKEPPVIRGEIRKNAPK